MAKSITNPLIICIDYNSECRYDITDRYIKLSPIYDNIETQTHREENVSFKLLFKFIKPNKHLTPYYPYHIEYIDNEEKKIFIRFPTLSYEKALNYKLFYDFTNIYSLENASIQYIYNIQHLEFNIRKYSIHDLTIEINSDKMKIIQHNNNDDERHHLHLKFVNDMFIRSILAMRKCKNIEQQPDYILKQFLKIENTDNTICSICLEDDKENDKKEIFKHPKCSHVFHYDCIKKWVNQGRSQICCPNCRVVY